MPRQILSLGLDGQTNGCAAALSLLTYLIGGTANNSEHRGSNRCQYKFVVS